MDDDDEVEERRGRKWSIRTKKYVDKPLSVSDLLLNIVEKLLNFSVSPFSQIPNYLLSLLDPWYQVLPHDVHRATFDLLLTKSAVNPLIYIYGLRSLRHEVKLFCMCRCRSDRGTANMFRPSSTSGWSNDDQQQTRIVKERMATVVK